MFFTQEKLETRIRLLEELRYSGMEEIFPLEVREDIRDEDQVVQWPPVAGEGISAGKYHLLPGRNKYYWAEKKVWIPRQKEGYQTVGLFDMGKTGAGTNSGFESLLYINQEPYQAVDTNHKEVFFGESHWDTDNRLSFLLWSGLEGGGAHQEQMILLRKAEIGYLHTVTDEFYFLGKAVFKTVRMLHEGDETKDKLMSALNRAVMSLDFSETREKLYAQVEKAYPVLLKELEEMKKDTEVTVHCVGHTHIDVAWLWRLKHTQEKAQRSFATVLRYMEQFEDYRFVQSQPQLYDYVKKNVPEFYQKMKERIAEGRFEPEGAMWVEADCNISSGEALARQILEGNKFFEKEFGKRCTCLWLPDVFGYSVALPQIMKLCNINRFVTTKISWNEYNKMPHDTFYWKGLDGSSVLTYFITTPEEGFPEGHMYSTYNGQISPRTVLGSWRKYEDKNINKDILISYGYGDGGGGPTRTMLMMRRSMDKVPGLPNVKQTSVGEFLDIVEENLNTTENYVPTWSGELYLENHRGTYTSQGRNKRYNRKMEYALIGTEMQNIFSSLSGGTYYGEELEGLWRELLLNQFHDIIPGSSIREVYEDSQAQYEKMKRDVAVLRDRINRICTAGKENTWHIFNPLVFGREEAVCIPVTEEGYFTDQTGRKLEMQREKDKTLVNVFCIPLGYTQITFHPGQSQETSGVFVYSENVLETPYYTVEWDKKGVIKSLYDRENQREVLRQFGNRLTVYEDRPYNNDAWNIDLFHLQKYEVVENLVEVKVAEQGALRFALEFCYQYRDSVITQQVRFYRDSRRIDFVTKADWHENHRLLKACFDVNVDSLYAQYDVQYGNVTRNTHFNTSWDWAKFEVAAHKWADLSETGYGVSLLNDCKYGYSIHENRMNLSLIKCATFPDTQADQGEHVFTYSLLPHKDSWQQADVHREAECLNQPLEGIAGKQNQAGKSLFITENKNITVDAVKKAENSQNVIVRFHEYHGKRGWVNMDSNFPVKCYREVNIMEDAAGEWKEEDKISEFVKPYEIKTYEVVFGEERDV